MVALIVKLHPKVRQALASQCSGSTPVRVARRARILLSLHKGMAVDEVAQLIGCGEATVRRVRRRYLDEGWERAIAEGARPGRPKHLDYLDEREIIALRDWWRSTAKYSRTRS